MARIPVATALCAAMLGLHAPRLLAQTAAADGTGRHVPDAAYEWYPRYVTFLPSDRIDSVLQYANTDIVPVIYKLDRTELIPNAQLDSICRLIHDVIHDYRVHLAYVWVGGSASPEGPTEHNRWLGQTRAERLVDYLQQHAGVKARQLRMENLWEDWYSMARALERTPIDYRLSPIMGDGDGRLYTNRVLDIIRTVSNYDERKRQIQKLDNGRTWQWLIDNVFPPFRNARMVIVCHAEDLIVPEPLYFPNPTVELPNSIRLNLPPMEMPVAEKRFYALKTNMLFLAALTANIGFEAELWRKTSIDVPFWYSPYDIRRPDRKLRLLAIQPEFRYWLGKRAGEGHFLGLHGQAVGFNVAINDHGRYQDPNHALWGGGIGWGWATHLDRKHHVGLEVNVGFGYANYRYRAYHNWSAGPKYSSPTHTGGSGYWGLTRAGVNIYYKWYANRRQGKKGGSHAK